MYNNKISSLINKILFRKPSYPSLRYRYFCKLLEKDFVDTKGATLLAVSPICKPKFAINFALFLGYSLSNELNARVMLVDTNFSMSRNSLTARLNARNREGFFQLVQGESDSLVDKVLETSVKNVFLLPSGANKATVRSVIDHDRLAQICEEAKTMVDYVIFVQDDIRADTRYVSLSYLINMNLLLIQKNSTLLSDIDECQKLYQDNDINQYKLIMTSI